MTQIPLFCHCPKENADRKCTVYYTHLRSPLQVLDHTHLQHAAVLNTLGNFKTMQFTSMFKYGKQ